MRIPCIRDAIEVGSIKARNTDTNAVLLTFNQSVTPYDINILAGPADTPVYKHRDRPMIFHKFYKHGHSNKNVQ